MGFLDNMKEKKQERDIARAADLRRQEIIRSNASAEYHYGIDHAEWSANLLVLRKMVEAFRAANAGKDAISSTAVLRKGEFAIWEGQASLHEARRLPGQYVGRSSGVSIPIGKTGLRYRTGATKGTFVQGNEVQQMIENGRVLLTTSRLIFNGNTNTKEWAFAKWVGAEASGDETDFMFHVSNRQKASGLSFRSNPASGHEFNLFLAQALDVARKEISGVFEELVELLGQSEAAEPVAPKPLSLD